jgi:hypothetical protein
MKYREFTIGQIEAIFNKLGEEAGVLKFLAGETEVVKKPVMIKKLPTIITINEKSELKIIKSDIPCISSSGKKLFSEIDECIKKTTYDGMGGDPEISHWSELNRPSNPKPKAKIAVYESFKKDDGHFPLSKMFHCLSSIVDGDIRKLSLNADQLEYVVMNNKQFITEIGYNPNIFFIEADFKILPVSINPRPGGFGKKFETGVYLFGDMDSYQAVRFFVPQI